MTERCVHHNEALHVIGLHGSGDKICLFLQDWELAKVASSCHMALDILCQESGKEMWLVCVLSGLAGFLPFKNCCSVYTLCVFGMNVGFQTCLGVMNSKRAEGELPPCAGIEAVNSQRVDWFLPSS